MHKPYNPGLQRIYADIYKSKVCKQTRVAYSSRPIPDILNPPNGAAGLRMLYAFTLKNKGHSSNGKKNIQGAFFDDEKLLRVSTAI